MVAYSSRQGAAIGEADEEDEPAEDEEAAAPLTSAHRAEASVPDSLEASQRLRRRRCVALSTLGSVAAALVLLATRRSGFAAELTGLVPTRWRHVAQGLWSIRSDSPEDVPASRAECAFDAPLGSTYLGRAGLELRDAVFTCPEAHATEMESLEMYQEAAHMAWEILHNHTSEAAPEFSNHMGEVSMIANISVKKARAVLKQVEASHDEMRQTWVNRSGSLVPEEEHPPTWKEVLELWHNATYLSKRAEALERLCVALTTGTFASFAFSAAFLAASVTECPSMFEQKTYCAADVARILASIAELAEGAAATSAECTEYAKYLPDDGGEINRRLFDQSAVRSSRVSFKRMFEALNSKNPGYEASNQSEDEDRQVEIAACVIDASQGTVFLGKFGTDINAANIQCREEHRDNCESSIASAIESLSMTSMMFSNAVSECPGTDDFSAWCSSSISQIVAALSGAISGLTASRHVCKAQDVFE